VGCSLNVLKFDEGKFEILWGASFSEVIRDTRSTMTYLIVILLIPPLTYTKVSVTKSHLTSDVLDAYKFEVYFYL